MIKFKLLLISLIISIIIVSVFAICSKGCLDTSDRERDVSSLKSGAMIASPKATTNPATDITFDSAVLNAIVNPNGLDTTICFQWGATTLCDTTAFTQSISSGMSNVTITSTLSSLTSNSIYYFRIAASNSLGISYGTIQTFTVTPRVILFSWDGVSRERIDQYLSHLPNLQTLITEGVLVTVTVTSHFTDTKAGHAQMLTGYDPDVTGVYNNVTYQPVPLGYTIFERLQGRFGNANIKTGMITAKIVQFVIFDLIKDRLTVYSSTPEDADDLGPKMVNFITTYQNSPFFLFCHFRDPDDIGHAYGDNSDERRLAIIKCDTYLGNVMQKLRDLNLYQKTVIYVTADHGFDGGSAKTHRNAPYVFLATNDKQVSHNGVQKDIVPTILRRMNVDFSGFTPPLTGTPLNK